MRAAGGEPSHARRQSVPDGGTQKGRGVPRPFAISFLKIAPALFSDFPQWFPLVARFKARQHTVLQMLPP